MAIDPDIEASLKVVEIPSTLNAAKQAEDDILREIGRYGYDEEDTFAIKLAIEEAMTNAVKHGNRNDSSKQITVRYSVTPDQAVILVHDQGSGFTPDRVPDPTKPERLSRPNGRGIMLMRAYMTEVYYRDEGTEVCLIKRRRCR